MRVVINILIIYSFFACQISETGSDDLILSTDHIKYFGFSLIDTYWDDPLDSEAKTNYIDEVANFTNIADILVLQPEDDIINRLQLMTANRVKAYLHLNDLFFEKVTSDGPSGANYDLRVDYKERWDQFVLTNNLHTNKTMVQAFYLGEEPTWNSISYEELKAASEYIKTLIPDIPILLIEAAPALKDLKVPTSIDWVGFDHYFIKAPKTDPVFLNELSVLKSKLTTNSQKIVLVLDAHYISEIHGNLAGITKDEMEQVAKQYYELAKLEPKVIALVGYTWPGGFDTSTTLGARQLPINVKNEYIRIGKEITGK